MNCVRICFFGHAPKGQPTPPPTNTGRPTDAKLREKKYTRKQIAKLARDAHERKNPRLFE